MKKIPSHIVLLPDGNRRWARKRELPTSEGHLKGREKFRQFLKWCREKGIKVLTVFGFSTENWKRSQQEVNYLMGLFEKGFSEKEESRKVQEAGVRVKVIGQKLRLPESLQKNISKLEEATKDNKKFYLNLGVSYGGRWDICQAVKRIIKEGFSSKEVTEELLEKYLSTAGLPEPDLVIRTGGEKRLSNFLLWQTAYSEFYFCDTLWPAFTKEDFNKALEAYSLRQRRFGGDADSNS